MLTNQELKNLALRDLQGNWTQPVLATLVLTVANSVFSSTGGIANILLGLPMGLCFTQLFLQFIRGEKEDMISRLFGFFDNYSKTLGLSFMVSLYTFLWSLLFIVPGIIKGLSYSMAFYISLDHPEYSTEECIQASMKMMDGHKMDLFVLNISFIGWILLSILTFGVGMLWVSPYMNCTTAHFYEQLKAEQNPNE